MGEVWRGVHRAERLPVAIKVVQPELAGDPEFRERFGHEVRAAAALDHPNIVLLFEQGEIGEETAARSGGRLAAGSPFLVMEWASGGTLAAHSPLATWAELEATLLLLLDALGHAHARGVLHRDLKLTNILSCTDTDLRPGLKLADFGAAHRRGEPPQETVTGTRGYMAPEQAWLRHRDQGPWTDLFSLGVLGWKLASGHGPFPPSHDPFLVPPPPAPLERAPHGAPRELEAWLRALLVPDPTLRFRRAADAAAALRAIRGARGHEVSTAIDEEEASTRRSSRPPPSAPATAEDTTRSAPATAEGTTRSAAEWIASSAAVAPHTHLGMRTTTAEGLTARDGRSECALAAVPPDWRHVRDARGQTALMPVSLGAGAPQDASDPRALAPATRTSGYARDRGSESNPRDPRARASKSEPRDASGSHSEPRATSSSHSEPCATSSSHSEPRATSSSHSEPRATSGSEPRAASGSEPRATSSSHSEPRATSGSEPRVASGSDSEPRDTQDRGSESARTTGSRDEASAGPRERREARAIPIAEVPSGGHHGARSGALAARLRLPGSGLGLFGLRPIPLVDRELERDALWHELLETLATGRSRVAVIHGGAGTGKSRLVQWLGERAHETGAATVLRASHGAIPAPAHGLGAMLARHLECADLGPDDAAKRLEDLLGAEGHLEGGDAHDLAALLSGMRIMPAPERHALVRRLCTRLAAERAVLAWIDDAQWGADALAFAAKLLEAPLEAPVFVAVVLRDDVLGERPLERALVKDLLTRGARRIEVGDLAIEDRAALVRGLLGLSVELAARVEERAGGNPLLALQLVSDLARRGALEASPEGFRLVAGADAHLPEGTAAVWAAALEQALAPASMAERAAIEVAAALGRDVDVNEWATACAMLGLVASTRAMDRLAASGLARSMPPRGWSFAQSALREAMLERVAAAGRAAAYHRACAAVVEGPDAPERRGRHLLAAGEPERAAAHLLAAADARLAGGESGRAEALLADLSAALDRAPPGPEHAQRHAAVAVLLAEARRQQGRYDEALAFADRAGSDGTAATLARAAALRGAVARERGEIAEMMRAYQLAREHARGAGEKVLAAACARWLAIAHLDRGETDEARGFCEEALSVCEAEGDELGAARARLVLGGVARASGAFDEARLHLERALAGMRRAGGRGGAADCLNALGELARYTGEPSRAAELYVRAASLHESLGSRSEAVARMNLGFALLADAKPAEARAVLVHCRAMFEKQGRRGLVAMVHVALLECAATARDWNEWDAHAIEAERLLAETSFADIDVARAAERAAHEAECAGEQTRAARAWHLASSQWRALGREDEASRAMARAMV